LTAAVALLERSAGYAVGGLRLVTRDAMANRAPCERWDRPQRFGAPVQVCPQATPSERLLAFLGRDPN
jgi:hypothetical protein